MCCGPSCADRRELSLTRTHACEDDRRREHLSQMLGQRRQALVNACDSLAEGCCSLDISRDSRTRGWLTRLCVISQHSASFHTYEGASWVTDPWKSNLPFIRLQT